MIFFGVVNYLSFISPANNFNCDDCLLSFGFPFYLYEKGGFFTVNQFIWSGLIADVLISILLSFVAGIVLKFIWGKLTTKKFR